MTELVQIALVIVMIAGIIGAFWAGILVLDKQRLSNRRYWLINPIAQFESTFTKEVGIAFACLIVAFAAAVLRHVLQ
jgi:hypothetical protein